MLKGLRVLDRWNLVSLLPERGNLHTQLIIDNLRRKLLIDADEMEALGMVTGVIHEECGNPVEIRGDDDNQEYYCLVCDKVVENTKGLPNRTIWNQVADVGVDVELKKAERGIYVNVFAGLDKNEEVTPQHVSVWNLLAESYPKAFTAPDDEDEEDDEE